MFEKITVFMEEKLSVPMAKLAEQRHLRAIRDGIIATLPLIIVSSISTPILLKLLFNKEDKGDARRDNNAFLYKQEREEA